MRNVHVVAKVEGANEGGGGAVSYLGPPGYTSAIWEMIVSYHRFSTRTGYDIAVWTHEDIAKGRKAGGPKYLEHAFQHQAAAAERIIAREVKAAINKYGVSAKIGSGVTGNISIQISKIGKRLNKIEKEVSRALARGMSRWSVSVLTESNENCPYETGQLRNSGTAFLGRK